MYFILLKIHINIFITEKKYTVPKESSSIIKVIETRNGITNLSKHALCESPQQSLYKGLSAG